jgi:hypothetical protein
MSVHPYYSISLRRFSAYLMVVAVAICIMAAFPCLAAEKIGTSLTINCTPESPGIGESFHVTGTLTTSEGKIMGNKRVTLTSSVTVPDSEDAFSFIGIKVTDRNGKYDFFRPAGLPPEYLRVSFAGNDEYEPAMSPVLGVRGIGTDSAQVLTNATGSVQVYTTPSGADIYVDGELRGVSPQKIGGISEGPHSITVVKPGYLNETLEGYISSRIDARYDITLK